MNPFKVMTVRDYVYLILIVAYSALFIAGHDFVSQLYGKVIKGFDRETMESFIFWGALLSGVAGFVWIVACRRGSWLFWAEGFALGIMLWISSAMLICTNVESVHYPQYAILGYLMRSLIDGDMSALLACNFVGMGDELVQYVLNPHYTKYLDFNDMVLNLIGVMAGIILWHWVRGASPNPLLATFWRRVVTVCYIVLAAISIWALVDGRVLLYRQAADTPYTSVQLAGEKAAFVLSYVDTSTFYLITGLGRSYHVMDAKEWLGVSLALLAFAWGVFRCRKMIYARG